MTTSSNQSEIAPRLRYSIAKLAREMRIEANELGVSAVDMSVLSAVAKQPGIGIAELAEAEGVSRARMSTLVHSLTQRRLVRRVPTADRRRVALRITRDGEAQMEAVINHRTAWFTSQLEALSSGEFNKLQAALPVLEKLVEATSR